MEQELGHEFGVEFDEFDEFGVCVLCVFAAFADAVDEFGKAFDDFGRGFLNRRLEMTLGLNLMSLMSLGCVLCVFS